MNVWLLALVVFLAVVVAEFVSAFVVGAVVKKSGISPVERIIKLSSGEHTHTRSRLCGLFGDLARKLGSIETLILRSIGENSSDPLDKLRAEHSKLCTKMFELDSAASKIDHSNYEYSLIRIQRSHMSNYMSVLSERIERLRKEEEPTTLLPSLV